MRKEALKFLFLIMVALGAGPAGAAMWQWSLTSANNATSDPSINWSEGMAPSAVNDSARAMMSVLAAWRSDISGVNTTAGTSTAYTLATLEGVNTTPATGQMIAFIANATNGVAPTMTVDTGNTYPIWLNGAPVPAGSMIALTPYRMSFDAADSVWALESGYGNPYSVPLGAFLDSTLPTPPNSNFILPAGQCISTTTYATYWTSLGSPASGSCPGGQFAVVDLRGRVKASLDNLNGTPANRLTSASTGCGTAMTTMGASCLNGLESFTITNTNLPPYTPAGSVGLSIAASVLGTYTGAFQSGSGANGLTNAGSLTVNFSAASASFSGTAAAGHNSTPFAKIDPNIGVYTFLRVI